MNSTEPGRSGPWNAAAAFLIYVVGRVALARDWNPATLGLIVVGLAITGWRLWLGYRQRREASSRLRELKASRKHEKKEAKNAKPDADVFGSLD